MRPLELSLHGATLGCCVALGAGLWTVAGRQAPPPQAPAAAATDPRLEARLRQAASDLESLRLQVADLRQEREALQAPRAEARAGAADAPAATAAPAAVFFQAALEDPKVRERIQAVVEEKLEADRQEEEKRREERRGEEAKRWTERRLEELTQKLGLNETQKGMVSTLWTDFREHYQALRAKVRERTLTREQAREELERKAAESDAKAQSVLTAEQFKQYQESTKPFLDQMLRNSFPGEGGRRGNRERPVP